MAPPLCVKTREEGQSSSSLSTAKRRQKLHLPAELFLFPRAHRPRADPQVVSLPHLPSQAAASPVMNFPP